MHTPVTSCTSGTTCETRSEHHFADTALYEASIPSGWQRLRLSETLSASWLAQVDAAVLFGRHETVATLRAALPRDIPVIAHGHKLSIAVVFDDNSNASATGAARDVSIFDQQGCLPPRVIFIQNDRRLFVGHYARRLAAAMARFEKHTPRDPLTVSGVNRIRTLCEEAAFRAANGKPIEVFASEGTNWTLIADRMPGVPLSPLNRVVVVKPLAVDRRNLDVRTLSPQRLCPHHARSPRTRGAAPTGPPLRLRRVRPPIAVGLVTTGPATDRIGFRLNTAERGNSNQGHTSGRTLSPEKKNALLQYVKTLGSPYPMGRGG